MTRLKENCICNKQLYPVFVMNKWINLFNVYLWFKEHQHLIRAQSQCILSGLGTCFPEPGELQQCLGCIKEWQSRARHWTQQLHLAPFSLADAAAAFAKAAPGCGVPALGNCSQPTHSPKQMRPFQHLLSLSQSPPWWPHGQNPTRSSLGLGFPSAPGQVTKMHTSVQPQGEVDQRMNKAENGLVKQYTALGWHSGVAWSQPTMCCMVAAANTGMTVGNHSLGNGEEGTVPISVATGQLEEWETAWGLLISPFLTASEKKLSVSFRNSEMRV